ncbi:MAG: o-succinylbenzoate synthase [Bacteroidetes bacterium]|nr:o-succinylbenzoate synthase [Bacteroidota bacterium]
MVARCFPYYLDFRFDAGTSRGILRRKETWFLEIYDALNPSKKGIGECAIFRGLSHDDCVGYATKMAEVCQNIDDYILNISTLLADWPSIRFGLETAMADLLSNDSKILFPSAFTNGDDSIPINGLIWMESKEKMLLSIRKKIEDGFKCIKLKIGAIDFEEELSLLSFIRGEYAVQDIEIRVDANGAFAPNLALEKLNRLSEFSIHSIEQPIKQGQIEAMAELCSISPIPIALDEELIGCNTQKDRRNLISEIKPAYIIIKPALVGGFCVTNEWIGLANEFQADWWITSALESNIGLNAIAQWTYVHRNNLPQGLGTGQLFHNNVSSPLFVKNGGLYYHKTTPWGVLNS